MFYFSIIAFVFGACIGSFLNVCIYRLPRELSTAKPKRSFCPHCEHMLAWSDNIPLLSIVALKGRCRYCQKPISRRYFLVELITALFSLGLFYYFGIKQGEYVFYGIYFFLACLLIVATFVDFEFQIIPDEINALGCVIGLAASFAYPMLQDRMFHTWPLRWDALAASFIGLLTGGGILYLVAYLGEKAFKKEAMGGGDIKLLAMMGTFLGWKGALLVFFTAPLCGIVPALIAKYFKNESIIPYGPFLSLAAIAVIFAKDRILQLLLGY